MFLCFLAFIFPLCILKERGRHYFFPQKKVFENIWASPPLSEWKEVGKKWIHGNKRLSYFCRKRNTATFTAINWRILLLYSCSKKPKRKGPLTHNNPFRPTFFLILLALSMNLGPPYSSQFSIFFSPLFFNSNFYTISISIRLYEA